MPSSKRKRKKKRNRRDYGAGLAALLNYIEADATPDDAMQQQPERGNQSSVDAAMIDMLLETEIEYDVEAPGHLLDPATALVCRDHLRRFADSWLEAKYDLQQWSLKSEVEEALRDREPVLVGGNGEVASLYLETPTSDDTEADGYGRAVWLFYKFITSPLFDRIARCTGCKKYYIAHRRQANRLYCSPECGKRKTAIDTMRQRRAMERSEKLAACAEALKQFNSLSDKHRSKIGQHWKRDVAERASKLLKGPLRYQRISSAFITRAVNSRNLKPPPKPR